MEMLNQYSSLFSLVAMIAAIFVPFIVYLFQKCDNKKTDKQLKNMQKGIDNIRQDIDYLHKDWDEKRKFSKDYDPYAEFQNNINKRR